MYISFNKRKERNSKKEAIGHLLVRSFAIYGIGAFLSLLVTLFLGVEGISFNILQGIGIAIILAIPFLTVSTWLKAIVGLVMGIGEHFLLILVEGPEYQFADAGTVGVIGWSALLLFGLVMGDMFFKYRKKAGLWPYALASIGFFVLGIVVSIWIPIVHLNATLSYNMITIGVNSFIFLLLFLVSEKIWKKPGFLCSWGSSPIIVYVVHFVLWLIISVFSVNKTWFSDISLTLFIPLIIVYFGIIQSIVMLLQKNNRIIKI